MQRYNPSVQIKFGGRRKILLPVFIMIFVLMITQTGCSSNSEEARKDSLSEKIAGFSIYSNYDDYTNGVVEAFSREMDKQGIKYIIKDANGDVKKQISDVESLVAENVDIIGILPMDEKAIRYSLNEATERKIPIVSITQIPWVDTAATISGGDYVNGKGVGLAMRKKLNNKGNAIILDYSYDIGRTKERVNGFMDAINDSDIKVIDTLKTSTAEETMDAVREALKKYPDINGFFASESNQLIGCGAALKALDRKDIITSGVGSDINILNMVLDGYISSVAAKFPAEHGELMAQTLINILKGEKYQKNYEVSYEIIDKGNAVKMAKKLYDRDIK